MLCYLDQQNKVPDNAYRRAAIPWIRERFPLASSAARVVSWLNPNNAATSAVDHCSFKRRNSAGALMRMIEMAYPSMAIPGWEPLEQVEAFLGQEEDFDQGGEIVERKEREQEHKRPSEGFEDDGPHSVSVPPRRAKNKEAVALQNAAELEERHMHTEQSKAQIAYVKNVKVARVVNMTLAQFYDQIITPPTSNSQAPHVPARAYDLIQLDPFYGAKHHPEVNLLKKYRKLFDACSKVRNV
jgi:hypothetical protein